MVTFFPVWHMSSNDVVRLPRWINLDDRTAKDTLTGFILHLSCDDRQPLWERHRCAMDVIAALNRIYNAECP